MVDATRTGSLFAHNFSAVDWRLWAATPKLVVLNLGVSIIAGTALFLINVALSPDPKTQPTAPTLHLTDEALPLTSPVDPGHNHPVVEGQDDGTMAVRRVKPLGIAPN